MLARLALALLLALGPGPALARGVGSPGVGPSGAVGPKGDAGPKGDRGDAGSPGQPGAAGSAGPAGKDGANGANGVPGRGITGATVNAAGHLLLTYSDASTSDVGAVIGPAGAVGQNGANGAAGQTGAAGRGIQGAVVNATGRLVLTYTDGTSADLGSVIGPAGAAGQPGVTGQQGPQGIQGAAGAMGAVGPAGTPRRVERYTATADANGLVTFTWSACTATPDVQVIPTWAGAQYVGGGVTAQTLSGATVQGMVSRATLLLSSGPFQAAPAATSITVRVIC